MDYGEVQSSSLVFLKAHCPCILPSLTWSIHFVIYILKWLEIISFDDFHFINQLCLFYANRSTSIFTVTWYIIDYIACLLIRLLSYHYFFCRSILRRIIRPLDFRISKLQESNEELSLWIGQQSEQRFLYKVIYKAFLPIS